MDGEYLSERRAQQTRKSKNVAEGTIGGVATIGKGLADGLSGVVLKPAEGLKKKGLKGFGAGMWKGLTGVVVKPVAGVLDGVTQTVDGVESSIMGITGVLSNPLEDTPESLRRLPRHVDVFGILGLYNLAEATDRHL